MVSSSLSGGQKLYKLLSLNTLTNPSGELYSSEIINKIGVSENPNEQNNLDKIENYNQIDQFSSFDKNIERYKR